MVRKPYLFKLFTSVEKIGGDYQVAGIIVARFRNHKNQHRYVVEIDANVDGCFYHIFSEAQLRRYVSSKEF